MWASAPLSPETFSEKIYVGLRCSSVDYQFETISKTFRFLGTVMRIRKVWSDFGMKKPLPFGLII
jgi:hypothetical protein